MAKYILALDQGTSSSRAILFDHEQNIVSVAQREITQYYPQIGWVEHDATEIYESICAVMREAMRKAGVSAEDILAVGITNQRETTVVWDRNTGKPVMHAIVWQCRRTAEYCDELRAKGLEDHIQNTTGLKPDAYFSATKLKWILDHVEGARGDAEQGKLLFGTIDSWLIWNLTGRKEHVTDYTNASRTMLYDIHRLCWDRVLLEEMRIPERMLPKVCDSSCVYGTMELDGREIPIAGIAGDQQASLFGQGCFQPYEAKNTYGTGCFLLMNTGNHAVHSRHGLLTTIAIGIDGKVEYALEGSIFMGGAVAQWLRDEMGIIHDAKEMGEISGSVSDNGGVYLVPAFTGLGAPYWDMYARGTIVGLTRGSGRAQIVRAAEECIAYQVMDLVQAIEKDCRASLRELRVDGGASRDDFLMQFQADMLGKAIRRSDILETTALGAACLAGLAVGFWKNKDEIARKRKDNGVFTATMDDDTRANLENGWHRAIRRSLNYDLSEA